MKRLLPLLLLAGLVAPATAPAAAPVLGAPLLGVAGDGTSVLAWSRPVTGGTHVLASVRPAGGRFAPGRDRSAGTRAADDVALAVGHAGAAAVVWRRATDDGRPRGALRVNVERGRSSGPALAVPGSARGFAPSVAVAHGSILVAWLQTASRRCGRAVFVSVATAGGARFGAPAGSRRRARTSPIPAPSS